mgnify:CR=1 FL=1
MTRHQHLGADHHGHVARLQAALDGLGLDGSHRLVVVLMQLVNLMQDGKPVRMSKRSGKAIALHDLLDEISVDAARYFFNSRASTTPLDFDLDLAVREDSENRCTMSSMPTPASAPCLRTPRKGLRSSVRRRTHQSRSL